VRSAPRTPTGLQPAVDPWPDAAPPAWTPDPAATVIKDPRQTRPMSPAPRPVSPPRPATAQTRVWENPPAPRPQVARSAARPPAPKRKPRRRRRFLRFVQVLLSVLVLISVPLVAMLLAYGYGNGHSIEEDARDVVADIARLLGLWLR